jgi:hypothetical protein
MHLRLRKNLQKLYCFTGNLDEAKEKQLASGVGYRLPVGTNECILSVTDLQVRSVGLSRCVKGEPDGPEIS